MKKLTMRERMLSVLKGRGTDETPFVQYSNAAAPNEEVWAHIGRENIGILRWSARFAYSHSDCGIESEEFMENGLRGVRRTLVTPKGRLTQEVVYEPALNTESIRRHYIKEPADYEIFASYLKNLDVNPCYEIYARDDAELGDDGIPMAVLSRTAFQQLWIRWVALPDLAAHMSEAPDAVNECVELLNAVSRKEIKIAADAAVEMPVYIVNFPDNITSPVIGVERFKNYCVPMYNDMAERLDGKSLVAVHMDGDLLPLCNEIAESGIGGVDSMSPPPDNDTSVAQALSVWPDKRLFVNFPSSVHLSEPDGIYAQAEKLLTEDNGSCRMWIQISENVPPGLWKRSFPQIVRAIKDNRRLYA
jgi:hypothetical protein